MNVISEKHVFVSYFNMNSLICWFDSVRQILPWDPLITSIMWTFKNRNKRMTEISNLNNMRFIEIFCKYKMK